MEIRLTKKKGANDVTFFVPSYTADYIAAKKIVYDKPIVFSTDKKRVPAENAKTWLRCQFWSWAILESSPFYAEINGKPRGYIYTWLKCKIGFVDRVIVEGREMLIPRETKFNSLKDETVYQEEFSYPAGMIIAMDMGAGSIPELDEMIKAFKYENNIRG